MEGERYNSNIHLQVKRLSLIDFPSENDALVRNSSSPLTSTGSAHDHPHLKENLMQPEFFESLGDSLTNGKEAGLTPGSDQDDQFPFLKESLELDSARSNANCNLRKSLAWDSAFFTSAGVLDPQELSCMIKGAEKSGKQRLPGIEEDFRGSTDSISTLESDNLVLDNLEAELFEDIRASIQKSSRAFTATSETCKATPGESQAFSSKKKMNISSQNQKHETAVKKPIGISKSQKQILTTQGAARAAKQDAVHSQVAQSLVRPGNLNPTLPKPPRVISKGKPTSTLTAKKSSSSASEASKIEYDRTTFGSVAGKVSQASSKAHVASSARRVLPKFASSPNASFFDSSISTNSSTSSLNDSSGSVSSDKVKFHLAPNQRKVGDRIVNPPSTGSTLKTPSKTTSRNRTTSGNSAVSAYLMSSKISSNISPASSISEWSSASSSSSCTINQRSKSRTSFETSSCRSLENDTITSDLNDHYNPQLLGGHENEEMTMRKGSGRKSSTQTSLSCSGSARPSGLRMPSPKIGFFDGVKAVRTPNGSLQSHASLTVCPKIGAAIASPSRSSNTKPKTGKLSHNRRVSGLAKINPQEVSSLVSTSGKLQPNVNVISPLEVKDETSAEKLLEG